MAKVKELGLTNVVRIPTFEIGKKLKKAQAAGQVVAFMGPPGCGKTEAVKAFGRETAKELNLQFVDTPTIEEWEEVNENGEIKNFCFSTVLASQLEELDVRGLPFVRMRDGSDRLTEFSPTSLFPGKGKGIVFLDEFPNARSEVQNALQQILLDHKAGNYKISKDIQFVIAGNRPQDNCGTHFIPEALRNRAQWFEVVPPSNPKDWLELMRTIGHPIDIRVEGYLISVGGRFLNTFNPDPSANTYAYATLRSWTMASDSIKDEDDMKELAQQVGGWVGMNIGKEFADFIEMSTKIDIDSIIKNPKKIREFTNDVGMFYSICVNLIQRTKNEETFKKIIPIVMEFDRDEFGIFMIKSIMTTHSQAKVLKWIINDKQSQELMKKYAKILRSDD